MAIVEPENYQRDVWQLMGLGNRASDELAASVAYVEGTLASSLLLYMHVRMHRGNSYTWLATMLPCPSSYTMHAHSKLLAKVRSTYATLAASSLAGSIANAQGP